MAAMRVSTILLFLALASGSNTCGLRKSNIAGSVAGPKFGPATSSVNADKPLTAHSAKAPGRRDFTTQVKPILEARCRSCHFPGGVMYQRLPFDRPETIRALGEKLFTRLKDENDRRIIREFLSQQ